MKNLLTLTFLFYTFAANGQVAIIKDDNRYTNVRVAPDDQSEIIYKIQEDEVFWLDHKDWYPPDLEWTQVIIPINKFSFSQISPDYISGFAKLSQFQLLEKLKQYVDKDFKFEYIIQPFDSVNRIIDRKDGKILAIDGRPVWGTDGVLPSTQVSGINVTIEGQEVKINRAFYSDIYECTNSFKTYKNGDNYLVYQLNNDGVRDYVIVWVLNKDGLQQRFFFKRPYSY